ncbi:MAG TPA: UDP-N-acetylglucosamine 2-epimerase (non-hydrolyzing) [Synergistales bacterium]|nr:UDP-N-acetylglucosamine 2-epimerase (non-hydrolyzing) [Synergistales bacterium]HRV71250.1 UDP-N-acetylglucosamine 2-epimerase (non-hydrolyzing) [Thermovirgaceae bacterium]
MNKEIVCCVVGTRPEAIKMAPVILQIAKSKCLQPFVLATGQHTEMLTQPLDFFGISPDVNLSIMRDSQTLDYITASVLEKTGSVFDEIKPFMVLVHGDTTTTMAASLAAFYRKTRLGHVEAGLRSGNINLPFPEELNRIVSDRVSGWWFPPTTRAMERLIAEGCDPSRVIETGNTVIDALVWASGKVEKPGIPQLEKIPAGARVMLMTAHRRESWGEPLEGICETVSRITEIYPDLWVIVPMHKNPQVREVIKSVLGGNERVLLCEPLDYPDFVWAMNRSAVILTDSGGVQEETTYLRIPTLVMRDVTERPEALEYGTSFLVGTDPVRIRKHVSRVLEVDSIFERTVEETKPPFGKGNASEKIVETLEEILRTGSR